MMVQHLCTAQGKSSADLEDEALLTAIWDGELDLAIQPPRPQQRRVQRVRPIGRHDDLSCIERCSSHTVEFRPAG